MTADLTASPSTGFAARLKQATVDDPGARFVYLNNFEVERSWGHGEPALPGARIAFTTPTVNRMEEMGVLLADPGDVVVLKENPDPGFVEYLRRLDLAAGRLLTADHNDPARSVTEDALASPRLTETLTALRDGRTYLMPLGVGPAEEELAARTGLPLAGPPATVCKRVNGKVFSRRLVDSAGLRAVPGAVCETVGDLADTLPAFVNSGDRVAVKESLGVSGRGMIVLSDPRRAESLLRLIGRRGRAARAALVVESWIEGGTDLNYQFVVSRRTGSVRFETVKATLVERGVHQGHRFPVELPPAIIAELRDAAGLIGTALRAKGFYGMAGVDAIIAGDGTLYPCLEINARLNMSTYTARAAELHLGPGRHAIAASIALRPTRVHTFAEVAEALGESLFDRSSRTGVLVNGFATLNAAAVPGRDFSGRIYAVCVAADPAAASVLRQETERRLRKLVERPC